MKMIDTLRKSRWSVVGVLLFLPLAVVILGTLACLPAPIGDPEKATIDKDLIGAWEPAKVEGSSASALVLVRGLDAHTYFVQYMVSDKKGDKETLTLLNYRGWLTTLGGETFLCLETLDDEDYLPDGKNHVFYWAGKIGKEKEKITVRPLADGGLLKDLKTQTEIETAITKNIKNEELYDKELTFRKLGKEDMESIRAWRTKFHMASGGN